MSRLLAILRTATTLDALTLVQADAIEPPVGSGPWPPRPAWAMRRAPLPAAHALAATWARLARPRPVDAALLADVCEILERTVPDPSARWPAAALPDAAPPPPRPTAANPRAWRGTRYRPPTPPTPTVEDARRFTSGGAPTRALLARLAPFGEARPPPPDDPRWSPAFRMAWAPALRAKGTGATAAIYGAWRGLGLDTDHDLSAAALALVLDAGVDGARYWLDGLAGLARAARSPWLHALLGTGLATSGLRFDRPLAALDARLGGPDHWPRVWLLCLHRRAGGGAPYLLQGLALRDRCGRPDRLTARDVAPARAAIDEAVIWRYLIHTASEYGRPEYAAVSQWQAAGRLPGFCGWLGDLVERSAELPPPVAARLAGMAHAIDDHGWAPDFDRDRWVWLRAARRRLFDAVLALAPAQRIKAADLLVDAVYETDDAAGLAALMQRQLGLLPHVCAAQCSATRWMTDTATALSVGLDPARFERLLAAPPAGWVLLGKACRKKNTASLIALGAAALCAAAPALLLDGFAHAPGPLWRTAQLLGGMRPARSRGVVRAVLDAPLAARDWRIWPPADLCAALAGQVGDGVPDPVPRKLKRHLRGELELTAGQLERAHAQLLRPESRIAVLLGLLRAAVAAELADAFALEEADDGVLHALQMLATIDANRRILRRTLRAHWQGEADVVRSHPRTRAWWAAHPTLSEAVWHGEHRLQVDEPAVVLRLESDPVEVLRMGTAVGSCLGLGGLLPYSAAAVVVDDNKRVVYARDPAGRVVARQLLALDEDELLVCYAVYPLEASPALQAAFSRFARLLASALGVERFDEARHDGYCVSLILANDWWDDTAPGIGKAG